VVGVTSRSLHHLGANPESIQQKAALTPQPIWKFWWKEESLASVRIRNPDRPSRNLVSTPTTLSRVPLPTETHRARRTLKKQRHQMRTLVFTDVIKNSCEWEIETYSQIPPQYLHVTLAAVAITHAGRSKDSTSVSIGIVCLTLALRKQASQNWHPKPQLQRIVYLLLSAWLLARDQYACNNWPTWRNLWGGGWGGRCFLLPNKFWDGLTCYCNTASRLGDKNT
jgi:hypothetical protein